MGELRTESRGSLRRAFFEALPDLGPEALAEVLALALALRDGDQERALDLEREIRARWMIHKALGPDWS